MRDAHLQPVVPQVGRVVGDPDRVHVQLLSLAFGRWCGCGAEHARDELDALLLGESVHRPALPFVRSHHLHDVLVDDPFCFELIDHAADREVVHLSEQSEVRFEDLDLAHSVQLFEEFLSLHLLDVSVSDEEAEDDAGERCDEAECLPEGDGPGG